MAPVVVPIGSEGQTRRTSNAPEGVAFVAQVTPTLAILWMCAIWRNGYLSPVEVLQTTDPQGILVLIIPPYIQASTFELRGQVFPTAQRTCHMAVIYLVITLSKLGFQHSFSSITTPKYFASLISVRGFP